MFIIKARTTYIGYPVKYFLKKIQQKSQEERAEIMQLYQFEKIYSQMENEFGKVRKGDEETYTMLLLPLEGNALKTHREFPSSNSRRLKEAIALVLFDIKERYTGETIDTEKFRNKENEKLEKALLMAFDPYTNEEVMKLVLQENEVSELTPNILKVYYKLPVMCLLRIKDSIETLEKKAGSNGYFEFIENYMGSQINGTEMNYTIMSSGLCEM